MIINSLCGCGDYVNTAAKNYLHSLKEVLKAFVKIQVIDAQNNAPNGMCMLPKTIGELTEDNQDLIDAIKGHVSEIACAFVELIKEAQALDEIKKTKSAEELTIHLQIQIAGLRTFAKIDNNTVKRETIIDDIYNHYPF